MRNVLTLAHYKLRTQGPRKYSISMPICITILTHQTNYITMLICITICSGGPYGYTNCLGVGGKSFICRNIRKIRRMLLSFAKRLGDTQIIIVAERRPEGGALGATFGDPVRRRWLWHGRVLRMMHQMSSRFGRTLYNHVDPDRIPCPPFTQSISIRLWWPLALAYFLSTLCAGRNPSLRSN